jgi:hypothetical protein
VAGGTNLYAYAGNEPIGSSDPSGLKDTQSSNGYVYDPDMINCIGYGSGAGQYLAPGLISDGQGGFRYQTATEFLKSIGLNCWLVNHISDCSCGPGQYKSIFAMAFVGPNTPLGPGITFHDIAAGDNGWTQVMSSQPLPGVVQQANVTGVDKFMTKFCCCSCKHPSTGH